MKKLAIIGASWLQEPLIQKAKSMGIETHVFAWAADDVGEKSADYFYPISIVEKERILLECQKIEIDGICSIASDLASITVNYVASNMGLIGNSPISARLSTNKHAMREAFQQNGDPSPKSILVKSSDDLAEIDLNYPLIIKPVDRSGSRGIMKLDNQAGLPQAITSAVGQSFVKEALVEEFVDGREYSVEYISYRGKHTFLALTQKYTTGSPHFIETGHLEPAEVSDELLKRIQAVTLHALDTLHIENGASHTELKVTPDNRVMLIEIGGRMGGDLIGSSLVELSTGIDFVKAVIEVALGQKPSINPQKATGAAAIRFIFSGGDLLSLAKIKTWHKELLVSEYIESEMKREIKDSSTRYGYFLLQADNASALKEFLPDA